jgi:predicted short-subunit dehydrogenase-like oxidoreductase (DUF2520 family)
VSDRISIAGGGRVARALGSALAARGWQVEWISSRAPGPAHDPLIIAVPDDALESVAAALAERNSGGIALHTSGLHGVEALGALAGKGFECGSLHPLQTIASGAPPEVFHGAGFAVAGSPPARDFAARVAAALGGFVFEIAPERRALYHAAAAMASNYVTALADASLRLLRLAGLGDAEARRGLEPLMRRSVENALRLGPAAALTGPIRRGDSGAVAAHLAALASAPESVAGLYRACGTYTLEVAREAGLSGERASRIEAVLTTECKAH